MKNLLVILILCLTSPLSSATDETDVNLGEFNRACSEEQHLKSKNADSAIYIEFVNQTTESIINYWLDFEGKRVEYYLLPAGESYIQQTFSTHPWLMANSKGECIGIYEPEGGTNQKVIVSSENDLINSHSNPPFHGTIFIDPNIINSSDPSTFNSVTYAGRDNRTMFDRRVNNWINVNAYLFNTNYKDGLNIEIQVNPEFSNSDNAMIEAQKYGWLIGQLPKVLRLDVETVWIHKGKQLFGGRNNNILIHTDQAEIYITEGIIEETLFHEGAHTSLDADHALADDWLNAQYLDDEFISNHARNNPATEDIAESLLPYFALRYRPNLLSDILIQTIETTIPNRITYFDNQKFNFYPRDSEFARYSNNELTIPVVEAGGSYYKVKMKLSNTNPLELQLTFYESLTPSRIKGIPVFTNNVLSIPEVVVGALRYRVEMTLVEGSKPLTFRLVSAEQL